jgi:hypothetical protein
VRNPLATLADTSTFVVTSNGPGGCVAKDTITVNWIPEVANAGLDSILCSGSTRGIGTVQPTAYSQYSYQWSPATGVSSDTSFQTIATVSNSGQGNQTATFVQTATHRASNCRSTDTVRLFVKPLPVVNAGPDSITICSGGKTLIGTIDAVTAIYSWTPLNGLLSPNSDTSTVSLNPDSVEVQFQKYFLSKTETLAIPLPGEPTCSNTDSIVLKINPLPFFELVDKDSICSGFSTNIGTVAQSGFNYAWSPTRGLANGNFIWATNHKFNSTISRWRFC